ncbi:MAG TPA: MOSC domain-containing protein [Polyangiales bacterium]|nr:MOSC domain-containing protein [Polyangiales bacterium]
MRGVVRELHRYPVKSLLGEQLEEGQLGERGLAGDRAYAFLDRETGKVATAKQPKRWSALLTARARHEADALQVTLGDGRSFAIADPALPEALQTLLGRPVRLVEAPDAHSTIERMTPEGEDDAGVVVEIPVAGGAPAGTLFDFAPLHFVTTASLRALESVHPARRPSDVVRFRPNLVLELEEAQGFLESRWDGERTLQVGEATLRVICATPRCAVPTLAHGPDVASDPELIRTLRAHNRVQVPGFGNLSCLGAYASVVQPGRVRVGDRVTVHSA